MSHNIFVEGSILNFGSNTFEIIKQELSKIKKPAWEIDEDLDITIKEDFDMRHIEAIQKARDRAWEEIHSPDFISKQKVRDAIDNMKFLKIVDYFDVDEELTKESLKKELGLE